VTKTKQCTTCRQILPVKCFGKDRSRKDGLSYRCKTCNSVAHKRYHATNTAQRRGFVARYYQKFLGARKAYHATHYKKFPDAKKANWHRRRARIKSVDLGDVTTVALKELLSTWTGFCPRCHKRSRPAVDHIVPISLGGLHTMANLQLLCPSCNSRKSNKLEG